MSYSVEVEDFPRGTHAKNTWLHNVLSCHFDKICAALHILYLHPLKSPQHQHERCRFGRTLGYSST
jgi:hypothetical protein